MTSGILNHVWGKSPAVDRIWAQVSGLRPSVSGRRILVPLQAFIDDSYRAGGTYILAGPIATAENWALFSHEWEKLLNSGWGVLNAKTNTHHFKYASMNIEERKSRIPVFLNTLERYISGYVATRIDISELERAKERVVIEGMLPDWTEFSEFYMAFRSLMDKFHMHRDKMVEAFGNQPIDFYFDDESQKGRIFAMWDNYINNRADEIKELYGITPRFESDEVFLPLQGADLLAGFARDCYEQGKSDAFIHLEMDGFKRIGKHKILRFVAEEQEDDLVKYLMREAIRQALPGTAIYDRSGKVTAF